MERLDYPQTVPKIVQHVLFEIVEIAFGLSRKRLQKGRECSLPNQLTDAIWKLVG